MKKTRDDLVHELEDEYKLKPGKKNTYIIIAPGMDRAYKIKLLVKYWKIYVEDCGKHRKFILCDILSYQKDIPPIVKGVLKHCCKLNQKAKNLHRVVHV